MHSKSRSKINTIRNFLKTLIFFIQPIYLGQSSLNEQYNQIKKTTKIDKFQQICSILQVLDNRRMGSIESNMTKHPSSNELKFVQCPNIPSVTDCPAESDPLRHFLKHRTDHESKVKTLSDVQKKASKRFSECDKGIHQSRQPEIRKVGGAVTHESHNGFFTLIPTVPKIKENKENNSTDDSMNDSKTLTKEARKVDSKSSFRKVTVNPECFIKVRSEPPTLYYEFEEMIGQGSYGQVFKAICKKTSQLRAIKILKTKIMREIQIKSLLAQMTLLSQLNHPSIVTLYDLFHHHKMYYVVMEYCDGGSAIEMIKKIPQKSELIIANIMKQIFRALSYMHSQNIVHRDIKLENIVFLNTKEEEKIKFIPIKIIDFGTAVKSLYKVVQNYPIAGTLSYIAPQALKGVLSEKSDLWSSGILMYILLTGVSPFRGKDQLQTKYNINSKVLNFNTSAFRDISSEAVDLLQKLLNRNMHKRISANDALNHPWLSNIQNEHPISVSNLQQLENYYVKYSQMQRGNNLISIIQSYLSLKKVTQIERQKLAEIFTNIDKDGNGLIEKEELIEILKNQVDHFKKLDDKEIESMVSQIDKNCSGKIDFNEFIIAMYDKSKLYVRQSLNEAFQYLDKDHTGFIEMGELKSILRGGDAAQVEYFINQIDQNNDRKISREEFITYLLTY